MTDANLVLGHLDPATPLAGDVRLDAEAARVAVAGLATELELSLEDCARGIRAIAGAEMAGALRSITVDRGIDPRDHTLIAFGGAGGLHAADVADELGITSILIPANAGVLAALGLITAPERHDVSQTILLSGPELVPDQIHDLSQSLRDRAIARLSEPPAASRVRFEIRYVGQSFELSVEAEPEHLRAAFEAEHQARYGFTDPEGEIELVTVRVSVFGPVPTLPTIAHAAWAAHRPGPAVIRLPETTVLIPDGWVARQDAASITLARAGTENWT